jgi:hypothetical protein
VRTACCVLRAAYCVPHAADQGFFTQHVARRTNYRTSHAARRTLHAVRTLHAARRTLHVARCTSHAARRTLHAPRRTLSKIISKNALYTPHPLMVYSPPCYEKAE